MQTEQFPHKVAAIYTDAARVDAAIGALRDAAVGDVRLNRLAPDSPDPGRSIEPEQAGTRNRFIVDILAGTGIGTAMGAVGAGAIAIGLPTLFVSAPVVGPLVVAGYGATLGATAGAIKAFRVKEGLLADVVKDSLDRGFHVLIVHAPDAETQERAEHVIEQTVTEDTFTARG